MRLGVCCRYMAHMGEALKAVPEIDRDAAERLYNYFRYGLTPLPASMIKIPKSRHTAPFVRGGRRLNKKALGEERGISWEGCGHLINRMFI